MILILLAVCFVFFIVIGTFIFIFFRAASGRVSTDSSGSSDAWIGSGDRHDSHRSHGDHSDSGSSDSGGGDGGGGGGGD